MADVHCVSCMQYMCVHVVFSVYMFVRLLKVWSQLGLNHSLTTDYTFNYAILYQIMLKPITQSRLHMYQ